MEPKVQSTGAVRDEVNLFPEWRSREVSARAAWARLASVGLHVLVISLVAFTPLGRGPAHDMARSLVGLREPFRLVAPPPELTQTAAN